MDFSYAVVVNGVEGERLPRRKACHEAADKADGLGVTTEVVEYVDAGRRHFANFRPGGPR